MKLTEHHVNDADLHYLIKYYDGSHSWVGTRILKALLELKQRRAEDRQRENDGK